MEKNGYKRSDSRNGYWKNGAAASVNRYVKDRNGSRFRSHQVEQNLIDSGANQVEQDFQKTELDLNQSRRVS